MNQYAQYANTLRITSLVFLSLSSLTAFGEGFREECIAKNGRISVGVDHIVCYCPAERKDFDPLKEDCKKKLELPSQEEKSSASASAPSTDARRSSPKIVTESRPECHPSTSQIQTESSLQSLDQACASLSQAQSSPQRPPTNFYGFHEMFEELTSSSSHPCDIPKRLVQEKALKALDASINRYKGQKSISHKTYKPTENLKPIILKRWKTLLGHVWDTNQKYGPTSQTRDTGIERTMTFVRNSLNRDSVPVPTFLDEENKGIDHYRWTSLSKHLFLGFSPVTIKDISPQELAKRVEHPIRPAFLSDMYLIADHDIQHDELTSGLLKELGTEDSVRCHKWSDCLSQLPDRGKSEIRIAEYYLFHEGSYPLRYKTLFGQSRFSHLASSNINAFEFVFEQFLHSKEFSLDHITGNTEDEKKGFCKDFLYILDGPSTEKLELARSTLRSSVGSFFTEGGYSDLVKDLRAYPVESSSKGFLGKVHLLCKSFYSVTPISSNADQSIQRVFKRFKPLEGDEFRRGLKSAVNSFIVSMNKVRNNFALVPACQEVIQFRDPNLMHDAIEKGDWVKLKELMERAPEMLSDHQHGIGTPVMTLLKKKGDPNAAELTQRIVEKSPDLLSIKDEKGRTPIETACRELNIPLLESLLGAQSSLIDYRNSKAENLLTMVLQPDQTEEGLIFGQLTFLPRTHSRSNILRAAQILLEKKPLLLAQKDSRGLTPIISLLQADDVESLKILLEIRPELIRYVDKEKRRNLLNRAVELTQRNSNVIPFLIDKEPKLLDEKSLEGLNPLQEAAIYCNYGAARQILVGLKKIGITPSLTEKVKGHGTITEMVRSNCDDHGLAEFRKLLGF